MSHNQNGGFVPSQSNYKERPMGGHFGSFGQAQLPVKNLPRLQLLEQHGNGSSQELNAALGNPFYLTTVLTQLGQ